MNMTPLADAIGVFFMNKKRREFFPFFLCAFRNFWLEVYYVIIACKILIVNNFRQKDPLFGLDKSC